MSRCTVCGHERRPEIDSALIAGASVRDVAGRFALSKTAVQRHLATHLAAKTAEANRVIQRDILSEVEQMIERLDRALDRAEDGGDDRLLVLAIHERRGMVELLAKLLGELDERPEVNLVLAPEWVTFRVTLLKALLPYPEARQAAATALLAVEEGSHADHN
jgi:hypothetical protein